MAISFKGAHFPPDIILMGVSWYVAYPLSYRHVEELMEERGVPIDHATIQRWVVKYKQIPRSPRRNALPVKRIDGALLMCHQHPTGALVELRQIGKTSSGTDGVLHHPPKTFDGVEVVPTMGG